LFDGKLLELNDLSNFNVMHNRLLLEHAMVASRGFPFFTGKFPLISLTEKLRKARKGNLLSSLKIANRKHIV
jgi:hypothetical protein